MERRPGGRQKGLVSLEDLTRNGSETEKAEGMGVQVGLQMAWRGN